MVDRDKAYYDCRYELAEACFHLRGVTPRRRQRCISSLRAYRMRLLANQ